MIDSIAINVDHVSKSFKLPHEKQSSVKGALISAFRGGRRIYEKQEVLSDVSFQIKEGEFFGIVGRNGSGKSTLLKLLAGIYNPTSGRVEVKGKLTPFIELGVGFNHELTGRENVFLNGALLGFNRAEMDAMYDDIVSFAELSQFMDQKLKNYSSGMQVRLAFSIAIRAKSDILLLDEVLAVGDAAFQKKCLEHFSYLKASKQTVVFVSHDMMSMQKYCDRVAWIDKGELKLIGNPRQVTEKYMEIFVKEVNSDKKSKQKLPLGIASAIDVDVSQVKVQKVWVEDGLGRTVGSLSEKNDSFMVKFRIKALRNVKGIVPGVIVTNDLGEFVTASNSIWGGYDCSQPLQEGSTHEVVFRMPNILEKGTYAVSVNVVAPDLTTFYAWKNEAYQLDSDKIHVTGAKVNPKFEVEVNEI